jgi:hypothetical protein
MPSKNYTSVDIKIFSGANCQEKPVAELVSCGNNDSVEDEVVLSFKCDHDDACE